MTARYSEHHDHENHECPCIDAGTAATCPGTCHRANDLEAAREWSEIEALFTVPRTDDAQPLNDNRRGARHAEPPRGWARLMTDRMVYALKVVTVTAAGLLALVIASLTIGVYR